MDKLNEGIERRLHYLQVKSNKPSDLLKYEKIPDRFLCYVVGQLVYNKKQYGLIFSRVNCETYIAILQPQLPLHNYPDIILNKKINPVSLEKSVDSCKIKFNDAQDFRGLIGGIGRLTYGNYSLKFNKLDGSVMSMLVLEKELKLKNVVDWASEMKKLKHLTGLEIQQIAYKDLPRNYLNCK